MRNCQNLQRHRIAAFTKTLVAIETHLERKIQFINDVADLYRFNRHLTRQQLKRCRRWLGAVQTLKDMEHRSL